MQIRIRRSTPNDFPRIVEIINSQEREPTTMESFLRSESMRPADMPHFRLVAENEEGVLVGTGAGFHAPEQPEGVYGARVRVDRPYRRQGVATQIYRQLEDWAVGQGARRIESTVREGDDDAMTWIESIGWKKEHHLFESTLDLTTWEAPAELAEVLRKAEASGIRFTHLSDEVQGEELFRRYYDFIGVMMKDVPVFGERPMIAFDLWKKYVTGDPHFDPANVMLAVDGDKWVALCDLQIMESGGAYHGLTSVDREYRGRGLSSAIKVYALQYAKAKGIPYVRTNNHSANERMLAVNRKFGYTPAPGFYTVAKTLQA